LPAGTGKRRLREHPTAKEPTMGSEERDEVADPELLRRRADEMRAVEEAGGGESEGFEQAEEELIDRIEGSADEIDPTSDRFPAEESDPADHTAYGDADEVQSDVDEDPDSPGELRGS
jgi:hypothetical protein